MHLSLFFVLISMFSFVKSDLRVIESNKVTEQSIWHNVATFGSPSYYSIYGDLSFGTYTDCKINSFTTDFLLIKEKISCNVEDIALLASIMGARLIIFSSFSASLLVPNNPEVASKIQIPVISISHDDYKKLKEKKDNQLWAIFKHDLIVKSELKLNLVLSGIYDLDLEFLKVAQSVSEYDHANHKISIGFLYLNEESSLIDNTLDDCISIFPKRLYCLRAYQYVKGSNLLKNLLRVLEYFYNSNLNSQSLKKIVEMYSACGDDWSKTCIENHLESPILSLLDFEIFTGYYTGSITPFIEINDQEIYWPKNLYQAIYLSQKESIFSFASCNENCTNIKIQNNKCDIDCNTKSCGYDNMNCLKDAIKGYIFESDKSEVDYDNYNRNLKSDPCYLSCSQFITVQGLCPYECKGECFENCDKTKWCGPACNRDDFKKGICSPYCEEACLEECESKRCKGECTYEMMSNNLCPRACGSDCFIYCNKSIWCSPDCKIIDIKMNVRLSYCSDECRLKYVCATDCTYYMMENNMCPIECSEDCFSYCNKTLFCNPGCKIKDMQNNVNLELCTEDCINQYICSPNCTYYMMENHLCPGACTESCFEYCDNDLYCSAGCLVEDLKKYKNIDLCTPECISKYVCTEGCTYDMMMEQGMCPEDCGTDCFLFFCNKSLYCSPGCSISLLQNGMNQSACTDDCENEYLCNKNCSYYMMENGLCPLECGDECFKNCNKSLYCNAGCPKSLMNDGYYVEGCNRKCYKSLICNEGCSFYAMDHDLCPISCDFEDCFEKCNKTLFCAAGCSYDDMENGYFASTCTAECKKEYFCATGCSYPDMQKNNLCPIGCKENNCFEKCNDTIFCSPDCKIKEIQYNDDIGSCSEDCLEKYSCAPGCSTWGMENGLCPPECADECFLNCDHDKFCSAGCSYQSMKNKLYDYCSKNCIKWSESGKYESCGPMANPYPNCTTAKNSRAFMLKISMIIILGLILI